MSREEVRAECRTRLEGLVRQRVQILGQKAESVASYNLTLKQIDESIAETLQEIDECGVQQKLPLGRED